MRNRPIGIFDSGFGGLTALKRLRELMPEEDIVYFADSGRMPYGGRSTALKPRAIKAVGVKGAALRALVPLPRSKGTAGRGPSGGVTPLLHEELLSMIKPTTVARCCTALS